MLFLKEVIGLTIRKLKVERQPEGGSQTKKILEILHTFYVKFYCKILHHFL